MAERKWKKISTWMAAWVMAVVFAVSGVQTAFAATSQHHAGCDTDGGGIPAGSRCGIQF